MSGLLNTFVYDNESTHISEKPDPYSVSFLLSCFQLYWTELMPYLINLTCETLGYVNEPVYVYVCMYVCIIEVSNLTN